MHHEDFDRLIEKHVPAKNLKTIRDILENLKNKVRLCYKLTINLPTMCVNYQNMDLICV